MPLRVVSDTLVHHGVSLTRLEEHLDEGLGRVETSLADHGRLLGEILRGLPEPGDGAG